MSRSLLLLSLIVVAPVQAGKIYRCNTEDGSIEFRDVPCGDEVQIDDSTHFGGTALVPPSRPVESLPPPQTIEEWRERKAEHEAAKKDFDGRIFELDRQLVDIKGQIVQLIDRGAPDEVINSTSERELDLQRQRRELAEERDATLKRLDPGVWLDQGPDQD